jgi:hypothetical protein
MKLSYKNNQILPNVELLPCPFCGTDNMYFYTYSTIEFQSVRIVCDCGVEGKYYKKNL